MKDLLLYILKNITTQPEEIIVEEKVEDGVIEFTITAHPDDVGRVIGKNGRIIKAIRTIMRVTAIQNDERVKVTVISDVEENDGQEDDMGEDQDDQTQEDQIDEKFELDEDLEEELEDIKEEEETTPESEQTESQPETEEETTLDLDL